MSTPITDQFNEAADFIPKTCDCLNLARRLETDRAALMEALEGIAALLDDGTWNRPTESAWKRCRAALTAARANFPQP